MSNTKRKVNRAILDTARELDYDTESLLKTLERPPTDWRTIHARHVDICRHRRDVKVGIEQLDRMTRDRPTLTPYVRVALADARLALAVMK